MKLIITYIDKCIYLYTFKIKNIRRKSIIYKEILSNYDWIKQLKLWIMEVKAFSVEYLVGKAIHTQMTMEFQQP